MWRGDTNSIGCVLCVGDESDTNSIACVSCVGDESDMNETDEDADPNAGRFVRYQFTPQFLKLNTVGAT